MAFPAAAFDVRETDQIHCKPFQPEGQPVEFSGKLIHIGSYVTVAGPNALSHITPPILTIGVVWVHDSWLSQQALRVLLVSIAEFVEEAVIRKEDRWRVNFGQGQENVGH